jgi:hypothetical protein
MVYFFKYLNTYLRVALNDVSFGQLMSSVLPRGNIILAAQVRIGRNKFDKVAIFVIGARCKHLRLVFPLVYFLLLVAFSLSFRWYRF